MAFLVADGVADILAAGWAFKHINNQEVKEGGTIPFI
jgi:hypothetical protein